MVTAAEERVRTPCFATDRDLVIRGCQSQQ
jgi:hypothetical protein